MDCRSVDIRKITYDTKRSSIGEGFELDKMISG